jgi:hypothetical protein
MVFHESLEILSCVDRFGSKQRSESAGLERPGAKRCAQQISGDGSDVSICARGIDPMQSLRDANESELGKVLRIVVRQPLSEEPQNWAAKSAQQGIYIARPTLLCVPDEAGQLICRWP